MAIVTAESHSISATTSRMSRVTPDRPSECALGEGPPWPSFIVASKSGRGFGMTQSPFFLGGRNGNQILIKDFPQEETDGRTDGGRRTLPAGEIVCIQLCGGGGMHFQGRALARGCQQAHTATYRLSLSLSLISATPLISRAQVIFSFDKN